MHWWNIARISTGAKIFRSKQREKDNQITDMRYKNSMNLQFAFFLEFKNKISGIAVHYNN